MYYCNLYSFEPMPYFMISISQEEDEALSPADVQSNCLRQFSSTDFIMEPGIFSTLKRCSEGHTHIFSHFHSSLVHLCVIHLHRAYACCTTVVCWFENTVRCGIPFS